MAEDKKEEKQEEFQWVCRFCPKTGPWQTDPDKIPRGWFDDQYGLRCKDCKDKRQ